MRKDEIKHLVEAALTAQVKLANELAGDNPQTVIIRKICEGRISALEAVNLALHGDAVILRMLAD